MKLCKDCKWFIPYDVPNPTSIQTQEFSRCERPSEVSLVTGEFSTHPLKYCNLIRSTSIYKGKPLCGPEGIWWEAQ